MTHHDYTVDTNGLFEYPNFGDAEIKAIRFVGRDVLIDFSLLSKNNSCSIRIINMSIFSMESDMAQNVVDGVKLYDSIQDASRSDRSIMRHIVNKLSHHPNYLPIKNDQLIFIEILPIAGPELVCAGERFTIETSDASH